MNARAAKLFVTLAHYMGEYAVDPVTFAARIEEPPPKSMDRIAAAEWRRVAPRLYELDRLRPREIVSLHYYCTSYAFLQKIHRRRKTVGATRANSPGLKQIEVEAFRRVQNIALSFGFYVDGAGRMNLDQPLPLKTTGKAKRH